MSPATWVRVGAALAALSTPAGADKPTLDEVKQAAHQFQIDVRGTLDKRHLEPNAAAAAATISDAFWYEGFEYALSLSAKENTGCAKRFGRRGIVAPARRAEFIRCAKAAYWVATIDDSQPNDEYGPEWRVVAIEKLPTPFGKHRRQLTKLAKDHTIVLGIVPAVPDAFWQLFVATKDASGSVKLRALLVAFKPLW